MNELRILSAITHKGAQTSIALVSSRSRTGEITVALYKATPDGNPTRATVKVVAAKGNDPLLKKCDTMGRPLTHWLDPSLACAAAEAEQLIAALTDAQDLARAFNAEEKARLFPGYDDVCRIAPTQDEYTGAAAESFTRQMDDDDYSDQPEQPVMSREALRGAYPAAYALYRARREILRGGTVEGMNRGSRAVSLLFAGGTAEAAHEIMEG